jgi:flagellar basal body-associated protein FliL
VSDTPAKEKAAPAGAPGPSKAPMLVALVNTVMVLAALGTLLYTQILFKRPPITEEAERARLEKKFASPGPEPEAGFVVFDPVTVNIATNTPASNNPGNSPPGEGKSHYATIGFSLELRDMSFKTEVETVKPLIMDKFVSLLGRRQFHELSNVQGRYILRSQLIEIANQIIASEAGKIRPAEPPKGAKAEGGEGEKKEGEKKKEAAAPEQEGDAVDRSTSTREDLVTNIYFTQFIIQ